MYRMEAIGLPNLGMGLVAKRVDEGLAIIASDVVDRPQVKGERVLTLTVRIKPNYDPETETNTPEITSSVNWKTPGFNDINTVAMVDDGQVKVNIDDADPRQTTLIPFERNEKKGSG